MLKNPPEERAEIVVVQAKYYSGKRPVGVVQGLKSIPKSILNTDKNL